MQWCLTAHWRWSTPMSCLTSYPTLDTTHHSLLNKLPWTYIHRYINFKSYTICITAMAMLNNSGSVERSEVPSSYLHNLWRKHIARGKLTQTIESERKSILWLQLGWLKSQHTPERWGPDPWCCVNFLLCFLPNTAGHHHLPKPRTSETELTLMQIKRSPSTKTAACLPLNKQKVGQGYNTTHRNSFRTDQ